MNNHPNNRQERIFKIFTPVRCMNRDQLPRYVQGNMTAIEKHLVEQHLVDCDLCCAAVIALQDERHHEPFERYSTELSNYLHREYAPAPKVQRKVSRTQRSARTRDSLLSYFWVIMFIVIGGGSVFLLQQHLKNRPALMVLPAKAADAIALQAPAVHIDSNYREMEAARQAAVTSPVNAAPVAAVSRDTLKKTPPPPPPKDTVTVKRTVKDTLKQKIKTDTPARTPARAPDTAKKEAPEPEKTAAVKEPEPEKEEEPVKKEAEKPAQPALSGDESLFRAAMQYQRQGNINEAIDQFRKLSSNYKYAERAKFQLALCYRTKGQNGKARRLLREIVKMEGNMKDKAQTQLDNMN